MPPGTESGKATGDRRQRSSSPDRGRPGAPPPWPMAALRPAVTDDAPMTPGGPQTRPLTPGAASGAQASLLGVGVSPRPAGRGVQVFSPAFDPANELGSGALGERLARVSREVSTSLTELGEAVDTVHGRVVGVETAQRALAENAQRAVEDILHSARNEFGAQSASLAGLRDAVVQAATPVRFTMADAREGLEVLCTHTKVSS